MAFDFFFISRGLVLIALRGQKEGVGAGSRSGYHQEKKTYSDRSELARNKPSSRSQAIITGLFCVVGMSICLGQHQWEKNSGKECGGARICQGILIEHLPAPAAQQKQMQGMSNHGVERGVSCQAARAVRSMVRSSSRLSCSTKFPG
jgi:hypothetical protein